MSSYIQSGNIILDAVNDPTSLIKSLISEHFNLSPNIITLSTLDFINVRNKNPYSHHEGKLVHCYICEALPKLNAEYVSKYKSESEEFTLINNTLYLYAPEGIGRSKLVSNVEKCLGFRQQDII